MTNELENVPDLRFPEFKGEWEEKKLSDVGYYSKSYPYSRAMEGEGIIHHIHYGDIHSKLPSKINDINLLPTIVENRDFEFVEKGDIIFADASEDYKDLGKAVLIDIEDNNIIAGLHTHVFRLNPEITAEFLINFTKTLNYYKFIKKQGTGISVLGISKKNLSNLTLNIPAYNEQQKIGRFFSKLDRQIELEEQKLAKLEEQKKGYMQKIFSQTLRFKDEEDNVYPDWIRTKLINIVTPLKGQDDNITNFPILTISASRGWLNQKERFSQVIAGNSLKKYTQVKKNDLSYNKGNSKVAKYGIVFRLKNEALVPNVYKSFRPNENIDSIFIEKYFHNKTLDKQLRTRITSTARTDGLLNISDQDFYDIKLYIPILQEQTKIADFLNKLDKLIEKQSSKIILLKHRKKGLLQKMFV